jgi:hypothetical protein
MPQPEVTPFEVGNTYRHGQGVSDSSREPARGDPGMRRLLARLLVAALAGVAALLTLSAPALATYTCR